MCIQYNTIQYMMTSDLLIICIGIQLYVCFKNSLCNLPVFISKFCSLPLTSLFYVDYKYKTWFIIVISMQSVKEMKGLHDTICDDIWSALLSLTLTSPFPNSILAPPSRRALVASIWPDLMAWWRAGSWR